MAPTKTKGGLVLPANVKMPQAYGKVISCGESVTSKIKEGAILVFFPQAGMDMVMDDKILKVMKDEEVYGVLENKEIEPIWYIQSQEDGYKYKVVCGIHRFHTSLALGFTEIPAVLRKYDFDKDEW